MRLIKMLGLAMVAAIAAMAFLGAGSASAVLCKTNESPCSKANEYPLPTTVLVSSPEVTLSATQIGVNVVCASHATLVHEKVEAGKLLGKFSLLDWTNCTGCKKVTTTALGTFDDERDTSGVQGDGKLFPLGTTVSLEECPLGAKCVAKAISGTTELLLNGGTVGPTGTATGKAATKVALSGFGCGTTGTWTTNKPYVALEVNGVAGGELFQE